MVAGDWYRYRVSPELVAMTAATQACCREINETYASDPERALLLMRDLLGSMGDAVQFRPPFYADYGSRLHIGDRSFLNADFLALGGGEITIGKDVLIGPSARLYTPNHPMDPDQRREGYERVLPVRIEDNVWLGGSVVVCPGVTIGESAVVGAGSVVTRDVPAGAFVAGNPARVIRPVAGEPGVR
ncbi:sugar O-acetyltransferase [Motilibacter sp. E257]|uniref:Sugar O-acetyltransferase n=2 Tax=Motilibacter deserti TaxID=2714956 RepID=A0ABX0H4A0_9ACTN|nr:sugar O-acetyltransferase [Motilibacter deserti]